MTIRFIKRWNGYPEHSFGTLSAEKELSLVGQGIAKTILEMPGNLATDAGVSISLNANMSQLYVVSREASPDGGVIKIGFGASSAAALTAATTGTQLAPGEEITLAIPSGSSYFACKAFGNDVHFSYGQYPNDLSV